MEAELMEVKREIAAIKFLLSNRRVGDPENPYILVYEHYTMEQLVIKENNLQTKENILLQQQLVAVQSLAGKLIEVILCTRCA
jgi:hypothetical protein